ncbi:MAG: hypothetical protein KDI53_16725, partial [Candidatus Accumulibacter sp.]|nr:hypothetical protein [Accumulibacter sp.]
MATADMAARRATGRRTITAWPARRKDAAARPGCGPLQRWAVAVSRLADASFAVTGSVADGLPS